MEVKVIKKFRDKETKKVYEKGSVYEGTEKRVKEIADKGYVESPKPVKKTTTKKESE